MRLRGIAALGAVGLVVIGFYLRPVDQRAHLVGMVQDAAAAATGIAALHPLEQAARVKKYSALLAEHFEFIAVAGELVWERTVSRNEAETRALGVLRRIEEVEVSCKNIEVHLALPQAVVSCELHILGRFRGGDDRFYDNWSLVLELQREENWILRKVQARNRRGG